MEPDLLSPEPVAPEPKEPVIRTVFNIVAAITGVFGFGLAIEGSHPYAGILFMVGSVCYGGWEIFTSKVAIRRFPLPVRAVFFVALLVILVVVSWSHITRPKVETSQINKAAESQQEKRPISSVPVKNTPDMVNPIGNLVRLGWGVNEADAKNLTTFEISNKSLPDMQDSADYFKMLHKPFALQLQQVPSITGLRFMAGIIECLQISISATDTSNLSELTQLKHLRKLYITQTPFTLRADLDISPLASLVNLETLNLNMSRVNDIEPLRRLTKLVTVNIGGTLVKDISSLKELRLLKSLDVRDSQVTDVSVLSENSWLEDLNVDGKQVASLGHLNQISSLTIISHVPFDMKAIGTLSNLKTLFIWGPPVLDLSSVRKLGKLTLLRLDGPGFGVRAQVLDIDAIGELGQLRTLTVGDVQINSLQFLAGHEYKDLVELNLNGMPITSVSELANIVSLKKISFWDVPIVDISPLLALHNLTELSLLRVPARADVISELQRRGVKVTIN